MSNLEKLLKLAIKTETFDTNNGWGFGGGIGKSYTLPNGIEIRKGKACHRHHPPTPYLTISHNGTRIIDNSGAISDKQFKQVLEIIELKKS